MEARGVGLYRTADEWKAFIEQQAGSGKSIKEYCLEHGVGLHCFYYWRKRLCEEHAGKAGGSFVEYRLTGRGCGALVVECPRGYRLHIGRGCDSRLLEHTLKVLARC